MENKTGSRMNECLNVERINAVNTVPQCSSFYSSFNRFNVLLSFAGSRTATKPSTDFVSLITCLLKKNLDDRLDWSHLVIHPFWQNCLSHLVDDVENAAKHDLRESLRRSVASFTNTLVKDCQAQAAGQTGDLMNSIQTSTNNFDNQSGNVQNILFILVHTSVIC